MLPAIPEDPVSLDRPRGARRNPRGRRPSGVAKTWRASAWSFRGRIRRRRAGSPAGGRGRGDQCLRHSTPSAVVRWPRGTERGRSTPIRRPSKPATCSSPCALARVVTPENAGRLNCRIIAGAANDTLAGSEDTASSARGARDPVYATRLPDQRGGRDSHRRVAGRLVRAAAACGRARDRRARRRGPRRHAAASNRLPLDVAIEAAHSALGRQPAALSPA